MPTLADVRSVALYAAQYGEVAAANWVASCSPAEFVSVCNAADFLQSEGPTTPGGNSMTFAKAAVIAAVYVHEGAPRKLTRQRRDSSVRADDYAGIEVRWTDYHLMKALQPWAGVGDDFIDYWAVSPSVAREHMARRRSNPHR